jgi:hypothetical protein
MFMVCLKIISYAFDSKNKKKHEGEISNSSKEI